MPNPTAAPLPCQRCDGKGDIVRPGTPVGEHDLNVDDWVTCPDCKGSGDSHE